MSVSNDRYKLVRKNKKKATMLQSTIFPLALLDLVIGNVNDKNVYLFKNDKLIYKEQFIKEFKK